MMRQVQYQHASDLEELLRDLPQLPAEFSFGKDVDEANAVLLSDTVAEADKEACFRRWASRFQPCLFGRLGAKRSNGIAYDICWITESDLLWGSAHVEQKIQRARRSWKDRAYEGLSSGFLILFNAWQLCGARPGPALVAACRRLAGLYLTEFAPIEADLIYTEALPLRGVDGAVSLFKGGVNAFYGGAHGTLNHDRRVPGGLLISVNSPGHLANSLVHRGLAPDLGAAVAEIRDIAWRSIGNGGIGLEAKRAQSCSWHSIDAHREPGTCPMRHRPRYVPENFGTEWYSALYHTDVLVPSAVTLDPTRDPDRSGAEVWNHLSLDYLATNHYAESDDNYGMIHGHPVAEWARYQNPWRPSRAVNDSTEHG